jgi:hypothetical protein
MTPSSRLRCARRRLSAAISPLGHSPSSTTDSGSTAAPNGTSPSGSPSTVTTRSPLDICGTSSGRLTSETTPVASSSPKAKPSSPGTARPRMTRQRANGYCASHMSGTPFSSHSVRRVTLGSS